MLCMQYFLKTCVPTVNFQARKLTFSVAMVVQEGYIYIYIQGVFLEIKKKSKHITCLKLSPVFMGVEGTLCKLCYSSPLVSEPLVLQLQSGTTLFDISNCICWQYGIHKHGDLGRWGEQKPKKWHYLLLLLDAPAAQLQSAARV